MKQTRNAKTFLELVGVVRLELTKISASQAQRDTNFATPRSLHIHYTIILPKSQIMERPSRVELLNAAFAVRYSADEHWAHGRKVGTRTPINGFGDRYATIAPPTYDMIGRSWCFLIYLRQT